LIRFDKVIFFCDENLIIKNFNLLYEEIRYCLKAKKEKFENKEVLEKLGPLLKLKTALSMLSVNKESFVKLLNQAFLDNEAKGDFTLVRFPGTTKRVDSSCPNALRYEDAI
jgi:hypothetical protein